MKFLTVEAVNPIDKKGANWKLMLCADAISGVVDNGRYRKIIIKENYVNQMGVHRIDIVDSIQSIMNQLKGDR